MKTILFLFVLLLLPFKGISQKSELGAVNLKYNELTQKYYADSIVEIQNKKASELYAKSKSFLVEKYLDNSFIIDSENLRLKDIGNFPATFKISGITVTYIILFSVEIQFKDEKYKIELTNYRVSTNSQGSTSEIPLENFFVNNTSGGPVAKSYGRKANENLAESILEQSMNVLSDLKSNIEQKESNSNDW